MEETIKLNRTVTYDVYPPTEHIDPVPFFSQPNPCQSKLFSHRMLASPLRSLVIAKIKDPLRKALEAGKSFPEIVCLLIMVLLTAWRIRKHVGKVTYQNSVFKNTHVILDMGELIHECYHNKMRSKMVESAIEVIAAIGEHDPHYRHILYCLALYVIKRAAEGGWITNIESVPKDLKPCWDNQKFLGGLEYGYSREKR